jgi:glyoxylase-like metal-dependent hydrolase (beta-lactamase superfamily II)
MRVHHLNCGTDCPIGGRLFDGVSRGLFGKVTCAAQLIETPKGLVLVDTGYGTQDVRQPHPRTSRFFHTLLNIQYRMEETALHQVEALGFSARDVRHIVLTHLDFDHAGGLEDFPDARVHVLQVERDAAERTRRSFIARRRYRPSQFDGVRDWRTYSSGGEGWMGFDAVRDLDGLPPEILLVPLPGHTFGHAGVAIDTGRGWLLNAGDAYFYRGEMNLAHPHCSPGLAAYQRLMEVDRRARLTNQDRLRALKRDHGEAVRIFCSHDPVELHARQAMASPIAPLDAG